jgi:hypothetical protein
MREGLVSGGHDCCACFSTVTSVLIGVAQRFTQAQLGCWFASLAVCSCFLGTTRLAAEPLSDSTLDVHSRILMGARLSALAAACAAAHAQELWSLVEPRQQELIERLTGESVRFRTAFACSPGPIRSGDPRRGNATYYVHVHKAGGTTVCSLARQNHEQLDRFAWWHNCNHKGDGQNGEQSGWRPGYSKSCTERMQTADSFQMLERWMDDDTCNMTLAIALRDPLDRIVSNAQYTFGRNVPVARLMAMVEPGAAVNLRWPEALRGWPGTNGDGR